MGFAWIAWIIGFVSHPVEFTKAWLAERKAG